MAKNNFSPSKFTILLVDDLPRNIQVLGSTLKTKNYNLEFATSGKKALEWLKKKSFDLVLLDLMMPEMDGYEVCQIIRANKDYEDIPVIFLTAKTDKESIVKGFAVGGQDYVTKPFDASELLARVKTHLELKQNKQKLKDVNKWLEAKVEERTEELKHANDKLTKANQSLEALSEQLISLDVEKTEFLQIISHEIRTPLNAIKGFLGLAKSQIKEEKVLNYFNYVDEASYRLEKFSIQALLITELRTKKFPIKKGIIRLKDNLEQILSSKFIQLLNEKNVKLVFDLTDDIEINADETLFSTCASNIIENAINYTNSGSEINFKAYQKDDGIYFETYDKGPGFTEKAISNLYRLFTSDTDGFNQGKGLDLAVVNLIMESHKGSLEVINNSEGGAIVKLFFPNNK